MRKLIKIVVIAQVFVCLVLLGMLIADKQALGENLIRLHVVADSDSPHDQAVKLQVRDAVISALEEWLSGCNDVQHAETYLSSHLEEIQEIANDALGELDNSKTAKVTLERDEFPVRKYDTFTLPSGIYKSLRITIGSGEGQNWWCVVFPSLCLGAASEDVRVKAAGAGFSTGLVNTISGEEGYEISFFLLDCLGKLENFFHFR